MWKWKTIQVTGIAIIFSGFCAFANADTAPIPDIHTLPRFIKGLKPGTLAWATIDQLHPDQPQTGTREVDRKAEATDELLEEDLGKFPKEFYENMYKNSIVPVYIGPVSKIDSRYGKEKALAYNTDRTHFSDGVASALAEVYGKKALSDPIFDGEGRPLNFVIVKIISDESNMTFPQFSRFMTVGRHAYLKFWSQNRNGDTLIREITFDQIPEKIYETTDNPYRSLVSWLQRRGVLGRSKSDFSQFTDAEILAKYSGVKWSDIDEHATKKQFEKAGKKAEKFIKSGHPAVLKMPGIRMLKDPLYKCETLLGDD